MNRSFIRSLIPYALVLGAIVLESKLLYLMALDVMAIMEDSATAIPAYYNYLSILALMVYGTISYTAIHLHYVTKLTADYRPWVKWAVIGATDVIVLLLACY